SSSTWEDVHEAVKQLQPGSCVVKELPTLPQEKLPANIFAEWMGTVIRLNGSTDVVLDSVLTELNLPIKQAPTAHPADRIVWLSEKIARYNQPLIIWTNASPSHLEFLRVIARGSPLTFVLLTSPVGNRSIAELVDKNLLEEARNAF